jgi:hypothetical protein
MEIANGWEQAVRNASNAAARVRLDGIAVLLELLEEIKSVLCGNFNASRVASRTRSWRLDIALVCGNCPMN